MTLNIFKHNTLPLKQIISEYCKFWNVRFRLFSLERLFEMINNTVIPMNSLLSHYEISLHLSCTLACAQAMGLTLRIAQQLKYFCYIDLLRTHIDDCEARLQDLEHILCLEQFETSMNANKTKQKPILEVNKILNAYFIIVIINMFLLTFTVHNSK